jgi:hypothetical protein
MVKFLRTMINRRNLSNNAREKGEVSLFMHIVKHPEQASHTQLDAEIHDGDVLHTVPFVFGIIVLECAPYPRQRSSPGVGASAPGLDMISSKRLRLPFAACATK